jgi:hypothetical protein
LRLQALEQPHFSLPSLPAMNYYIIYKPYKFISRFTFSHPTGKNIILFSLLSFILFSCKEKTTKSGQTIIQYEHLSGNTTILQAKAIKIDRLPYIYNWGISENCIYFEPTKSYKGDFNTDPFEINFRTHWTLDSIHGQVETDSVPFTINKEYILMLDLSRPDSGKYMDTNHIMFSYKLLHFVSSESKYKTDSVKMWGNSN